MIFVKKLDKDTLSFPPVACALDDPNGLLALGGDLSVDRLLLAYQSGIFPWYSKNQPLLWWSPDPRAILFPDQFHLSRSLQKAFKNPWFDITFDRAFEQVMHACAQPRKEDKDTWILPEMLEAYQQLFSKGFAHSVEVWHNQTLVGGVYGLAIGQIFFAESMFHFKTNASKIALTALCAWLKVWRYQLIDCQFLTSHLESLGVIEVSRDDYMSLLKQSVNKEPKHDAWNANTSLNSPDFFIETHRA